MHSLNPWFFGTWSIVARDDAAGLLGVAVTTCRPAVGAVCPHVRAGVGAISTQAATNPYWGHVGLDLLARGDDTEAVLSQLAAADDGAPHRQWIGIGRVGPGVAWTGSETVPWSGHRTGADYATAGNMLVGEPTITETERAYRESADAPLPERLMRALEAGQAAGGDKRGRQSAAMRVVGSEPHPILDLRVDDHPDPVAELRRLLGIWFDDLWPRLDHRPRRADLRL
jgi:uncharacterized Ntn-hydrolase superfamily protein